MNEKRVIRIFKIWLIGIIFLWLSTIWSSYDNAKFKGVMPRGRSGEVYDWVKGL